MKYDKIEIDGGDGVGKTTLCNVLKEIIPLYKIEDRGLLTKCTDGEKFCNDKKTFYFLLDIDPQIAYDRIIKRGIDLDNEFHQLDSIIYYRKQFLSIYENNKSNNFKLFQIIDDNWINKAVRLIISSIN